MAEQKTKPTEQSVEAFLGKVPSEQTRDDCRVIMKMMEKVTGAPPKMWGPSIVGFGKYHYKYESGHEGYSCLAGFSPRKTAITVYFMLPESERESLLKKLGKYKVSTACIYIKKLADIDVKVLQQVVDRSVKYVKSTYGEA
ncbi:DUF1801 domain-containing protein [Chryseolinea sp. T2]|uniref:DUF1801 domain-containing protein n=1 Tax=Chryseolinea sp. T2 TaxID=3129255 RepID=UPI003077520A